MKNFIKSAAFKFLAFVALFLVGIMIYAASTGGVTSIPETITGVIITPVQTFASNISGGISDFFGLFTETNKLRKENASLQSEVNELRKKQVNTDELERLNKLYRQYLELKEQHPDYKFADGRVIAVDATSKYGNFTINSGSLSGIKVNDPVITSEWLVGVVYKVGPTYSKVRTILDPGTQVSAYVSRGSSNGVTGGTLSLAQQGKLRLNYLSRDSGAAEGDYILTSGKGGIYPANLMIGSIEEVKTDSDALTLYAVVKPFADIKNLTDVFVITAFDGQGESGE